MPALRNLTATMAVLAASLLPSLSSTPARAGAPDDPPGARTSAREAARVDAVPTPRLHWQPCQPRYQCATARLPLDYDNPRGRTVDVALLKVPATDPARRIGSLFLNPGGPGGSGRGVAVRATGFLSPEVRARFDLIGMDPRGTNDSTRLQCYPTAAAQATDTDVLAMVFPVGPAQEAAYAKASRHLATACSTVGRPLSASMSTAEVARDLDVLRRAVGDQRLSYLGWSYGTYLGEVYTNLFPDRMRAVAIDGVIDPIAWRGSEDPRTPITLRLNSAAGSSRALSELLERCRRAGAPRCPLMPDPAAAFAHVAAGLRAHPLTGTDPDGTAYEISYADFVHEVLLALYHPEALEDIPLIVQLVDQMQTEPPSSSTRRQAVARYSRVDLATAERQQRRALVDPAPVSPAVGEPAEGEPAAGDPASRRRALGRVPLANDFEVAAAVTCSDSTNPAGTERWAELAGRADREAPYFGRFWLWNSAFCAGSHWTAEDDDGYDGRFDRRSARPVLVVGDYYDPATNYDAAVAVSRLMPNSRLLRSNSWGHTAYGTSACATSAVDRYLLTGALPASGTVCVGDIQPYS